MKKLHSLVVLTLVLTFATVSIYGQDSCDQDDETYSCAYGQSSHSAHWSVYIPIAVIVGAAIWFGLADRSHKKHDSYDSQDALGSIRDPKRRGVARASNLKKLNNRSMGSYSHSY